MRSFFINTAAISLALFSFGCARSPQVSFYTLAPMAKVEAPAPGKAAPSVAVGPVTLPEVVDRPQLVVNVAANRVDILEFHRWAEPLKSEMPGLIAQNLGRMLGSDRVSSYRQNAGADADFRVLLDVVRFDAAPGDGVTVETNWSIRRALGGAARTGHSLVREKADGAGYDPLAAAFSRALVQVSGDIASAIRAEVALPK